MKTKDNRLIRFLLESSQILLVFLGVFSALMCTAVSLGLVCDQILIALILCAGAVVFYALFTVLETFRRGKFYGILGITLFFAVIAFRFLSAVMKGAITAVNSFLKEFMNYTGTRLLLLKYTDTEGTSLRFGTNLLLILVGLYLTAIVSAFFYRRRRSRVFLAVTLPFAVLPLVVGKVGNFAHFFTYSIVAMTIIGTRHLRTGAADRRLRHKLAVMLMAMGVVCGGICYVVVSPQKYYANMDKLLQAKNSITALSSWKAEDVAAWLKANFNSDAITYGRIGGKEKINYTGETILKVSGDVDSRHGIYLKGYVGDRYEDNRWTSLATQKDYQKDLKALDSTGVTLENWHAQLRNELGGNENISKKTWETGEIRIRNLAFGYGNYLVPYYPTAPFRQGKNGKTLVEQPGIDYTTEYYWNYPYMVREAFLLPNLSGILPPTGDRFWESNGEERQRLQHFAQKYYLQTPDSLKSVCREFQIYMNLWEQDADTEWDGKAATAVAAVKNFIRKDTSYSLTPGKTPAGRDTVEYFLKEGKKGYCTYYATAAAVLLRSVGIPTRYVEGVYIPKEEIREGTDSNKEIDVPDEDAHAWIEVFDEKYGFVPVEVTPGQGENDLANRNPSTNVPSHHSDSGHTGGAETKTDDSRDKETPTPAVTQKPEESMIFDDIEDEGDKAGDSGKANGQGSSGILWGILNAVILLATFALVMEAQRRIRKRIFLRNMKSYQAKRRIRMAYHHLVPVMAARSVVYRGQSMAELTSLIAGAMDLPESDVADFVELVYHARFGPDDIGEEELRTFGKAYHRIREKAYEDVTIVKKLYYMYIMVL